MCCGCSIHTPLALTPPCLRAFCGYRCQGQGLKGKLFVWQCSSGNGKVRQGREEHRDRCITREVMTHSCNHSYNFQTDDATSLGALPFLVSLSHFLDFTAKQVTCPWILCVTAAWSLWGHGRWGVEHTQEMRKWIFIHNSRQLLAERGPGGHWAPGVSGRGQSWLWQSEGALGQRGAGVSRWKSGRCVLHWSRWGDVSSPPTASAKTSYKNAFSEA